MYPGYALAYVLRNIPAGCHICARASCCTRDTCSTRYVLLIVPCAHVRPELYGFSFHFVKNQTGHIQYHTYATPRHVTSRTHKQTDTHARTQAQEKKWRTTPAAPPYTGTTTLLYFTSSTCCALASSAHTARLFGFGFGNGATLYPSDKNGKV